MHEQFLSQTECLKLQMELYACIISHIKAKSHNSQDVILYAVL